VPDKRADPACDQPGRGHGEGGQHEPGQPPQKGPISHDVNPEGVYDIAGALIVDPVATVA